MLYLMHPCKNKVSSGQHNLIRQYLNILMIYLHLPLDMLSLKKKNENNLFLPYTLDYKNERDKNESF